MHQKDLMLFLLILIFPVNVLAGPILEMMPAHVLFVQSKARHQFITVKNLSDKQLGYVAISVYRAGKDHSWRAQPQRQTFKKSFGLIVSPRKLIVKPGQSKRVRVSYIGQFLPDQEKTYEVVARTVSPPKKLIKQADQSNQKLGLNIQAKISYMTTIQVLPVKRHPKLSYQVSQTKSGHQLLFSNVGNLSITLNHSVACDANKQCLPLADMALFPAQKKHLMIPDKYQQFVSHEWIAGRSQELKVTLGNALS